MRQIILAINALLKFKAYTLINVLGLACSLACVLTVARYIHQENTVGMLLPVLALVLVTSCEKDIDSNPTFHENTTGFVLNMPANAANNVCLLYTSRCV